MFGCPEFEHRLLLLLNCIYKQALHLVPLPLQSVQSIVYHLIIRLNWGSTNLYLRVRVRKHSIPLWILLCLIVRQFDLPSETIVPRL